MNILEIISNISEEARMQFKPDLEKYGKNFRAISESAVLDVLMPLLKKYEITYIPEIIDSKLTVEKIGTGSNAAGAPIQSLVFIAECKVRLHILNCSKKIKDCELEEPYVRRSWFYFEGWGSGVDDGDKATGKAYTAAVKYALFKGFKLQYSDDPDAKKSERIDDIGASSKSFPTVEVVPLSDKKNKEEPKITENMLKYLKGLAIRLRLSDDYFLDKYGYRIDDKNMPMRVARQAIDDLNNMPF